MNISAAFAAYAATVELDSELRESIIDAVKELDKTAHSATTILEKCHHTQGMQNLSAVCDECSLELSKAPQQFEALQEKIPSGEFYKYHHNFRSATHKLVYAAALVTYLKENRLATQAEVAAMLGLEVRREDGLHLDLEDYLQGCLSLGHELSRLAVNAVSTGDYSRPYRINQFLRELHAAYSLLNPKHDLRKRIDELKYAVKKTEEVIYNLSIRGLKPLEGETSG